MNKIFKYEVKDGLVTRPKFAHILRVDHVDDGFYKGDFLWAIVDTEEKEMITHKVFFNPYSAANLLPDEPDLTPLQISVKEKQKIFVPGKPEAAGEKDGKLYIYYYPGNGVAKEYNVVLYKTGQEIVEPIHKLKYIGLNRLWIIQELGLYSFIYNDLDHPFDDS